MEQLTKILQMVAAPTGLDFIAMYSMPTDMSIVLPVQTHKVKFLSLKCCSILLSDFIIMTSCLDGPTELKMEDVSLHINGTVSINLMTFWFPRHISP